MPRASALPIEPLAAELASLAWARETGLKSADSVAWSPREGMGRISGWQLRLQLWNTLPAGDYGQNPVASFGEALAWGGSKAYRCLGLLIPGYEAVDCSPHQSLGGSGKARGRAT